MRQPWTRGVRQSICCIAACETLIPIVWCPRCGRLAAGISVECRHAHRELVSVQSPETRSADVPISRPLGEDTISVAVWPAPPVRSLVAGGWGCSAPDLVSQLAQGAGWLLDLAEAELVEWVIDQQQPGPRGDLSARARHAPAASPRAPPTANPRNPLPPAGQGLGDSQAPLPFASPSTRRQLQSDVLGRPAPPAGPPRKPYPDC